MKDADGRRLDSFHVLGKDEAVASIRTNHAFNAGALVDLTGWTNLAGTGGAQSVARTTDAGRYGLVITQTTTQSTIGGGGGYGRSTVTDIEVPAAGQPFQVAMSAISSRRQRMRLQVSFYDVTGAQVGSTLYGTSSVAQPGMRTIYTGPVGMVVPAGAAVRATASVFAIASGTDGVAWRSGDTLILSRVIAEWATTAGSHFTGADTNCAWTGTANASASTLRTIAATGPAFTSAPTVDGLPLATLADVANVLGKQMIYHGSHTAGVAYTGNASVVYAVGILYVALVDHTSTTFAADLAAGKWRSLAPTQLDVRMPPKGIDDYVNTMWSRAHPPLSPQPVTTTFLASGFSLSAQLGTGFTEYACDATPPVKTLGLRSTTLTIAGVTVQGNSSNGTAARTPYGLEFILDIPTNATGLFTLSYRAYSLDPLPSLGISIDGHPVSANHIQDTTADTTTIRAVTVAGLSSGRRIVRIDLQSIDWRSIAVPSGVTVTATSRARKKVAIFGDSWIQGGGVVAGHANWPHAIAPTIGRLLGLYSTEVFFCGQGGTGYTNAGTAPNSAFGSTDRLTALYACAPDYIIIWGTQNDDANAASVQAAATAVFSAIATNLPSAKIIVVGPASLGYDTSVNRVANVAALKTAVTAASNVIGNYLIDPHNNHWMTGDGYLGNPDGFGIADYSIYSDDQHPTVLGAAYYARRAMEEIVWLFLRTGLMTGAGFKLP